MVKARLCLKKLQYADHLVSRLFSATELDVIREFKRAGNTPHRDVNPTATTLNYLLPPRESQWRH